MFFLGGVFQNGLISIYFKVITQKFLPLFENLKVDKAQKLSEQSDIDAYTGATFSGKAVQANIQAALKYYKSAK